MTQRARADTSACSLGMADTLYRRLRALERRAASEEDYRLMLEDFLRQEPTLGAALPEFSTFGLLEALRQAPASTDRIEVGHYSAKMEDAIALLQRLSDGDVSYRYPWYSPNRSDFSSRVAIMGGLFFGIAATGRLPVALSVGILGCLFCYALASLVHLLVRNSSRRQECPQWIAALHVDRCLQAYVRGLPLKTLRVDDLPRPRIRRKAPFYDLHNQIMSGCRWTFHPRLRETPTLRFVPTSATSHADSAK